MLKCCRMVLLSCLLVGASALSIGCGGPDEDVIVDPAQAVPTTDNPSEEPAMDDGP